MERLLTIGYQDTTQVAVLEALSLAGATTLVDVRAIAASRRPGFAKSQLAGGVASIGLTYLHLRGLGTPAEGRQAAREGRHEEMREVFGRHLRTPEAQHDLAQLAGLVRSGRRVCLLCLERQPHHCHRSIVAAQMAEELGCEVEHLMPMAVRDL
ncbi:MAG TPA: DUF488 domain-containing protein [Geminicoccaceae bacterium]|nr:DUF488 domain-containing protein [Geminicoccus sp.]HMU51273.1 DUF488 domain-containing protein [Geminicoccaceae bacterium]